MYFDKDVFADFPREHRLFLVFAGCERVIDESAQPEALSNGVSPAQCLATQRLQREQGFRYEQVNFRFGSALVRPRASKPQGFNVSLGRDVFEISMRQLFSRVTS